MPAHERAFGPFRYIRYDPARFRIVNRSAPYWFMFESQRGMIPVAKLRNPFAGIHSWRLRVGHATVNWRWG